MKLVAHLIAWCLGNRAVVMAGGVIFVAIGIHAALTLPIDAVPDVTNVQVQIITSAPALSPVEVEQYVTVPVERAMSGIPNVTEVRSISKYGLSVVTVAFTDDTSIYFARQLIMERMPEAKEAIPEGYGTPEIGPISTGLGEVFQFVVRGDGHSLMELEELLDWYIGPQLRSVPGVVEANSFGGEDKQYQVLVDPSRLQAAGLSIHDVAEALERTNANAGGGYIEHNREQLVIGTEGLVKSLDDLRSVVVGATAQGVPITVATIGDVQYGARLRRGAASMDGKGEVVVGVAIMLMGANARTVTMAVKERLQEIAATLPKGVHIDPFYDRSALVDRTVHTVATNLAEGALLVMAVLFLLLGNLRAGLVVAATIPLSMLFAVILMRATGMSGNLMSLGAIDFGLIVDGSVIIVENAVRRLSELRARKDAELSTEERRTTIRDAAVEMLSASVFGQAIIAIVYVPILALRGIEGKLFHPMANTVLFALLGAFVMSVTIIPVLASFFVVPKAGHEQTALMRRLTSWYSRLSEPIFARHRLTMTIAVALVALGGWLFTQLGAEFVPQLDEGDILFEVRRLPGVALTESVATDERLQRAVLSQPEVEHAVSKTGSPELATDPMGIEQTDLYLKLKPRSEWRPGLSKEQLGEELAKAVEEAVPEAAASLSQPIEMRTNELIAGVRSDVAAQIYGPDLEMLRKLGDGVASVVQTIEGAEDVKVEQGPGLNYLRIRPDRARLARYGLTVEDVNVLAETTSVGHKAGSIFENDRRFGLVVKLGRNVIRGPESFASLPLKSATGQMVPLGDVADIRTEEGPAIVNRDKQSRRTIVEFNVRGRDMVSVVHEVQEAIASKVEMPDGYRIEWGGQFQNFESARQRLLIVVPLALALIVFMLWMAFRDMVPAVIILLNIPFAVVGGVLALWARQIPFSISAGVGFIALFGVAVLNGLVLLSSSRQIEAMGIAVGEAIRRAGQERLRPVLMTALVAALGFVPMALSTAPGSEVQRPLATVVIGGLVTATALTLFVLPLVYQLVAVKLTRRS